MDCFPTNYSGGFRYAAKEGAGTHNDDQQEQREWIDADELEVLRSFVTSGVHFLIVGGRAVQFHGHLRMAKDLDLLVEFSAENWEKLGWALRPLNAGVPAFDRLSTGKQYQAKLNFYPTVEFLTSIEGVSFEQAWSDGVETIVEDVKVRVLSRLHLIASKQTTIRPLDAEDIKALRAIPSPADSEGLSVDQAFGSPNHR